MPRRLFAAVFALLAGAGLSGIASAQPPKPDPKIELHAPKFDGPKVERKFSSPADDLAIGGGGRFLIFHHPSERKLSIFDVNEGEFVKSISADDDNVRFAASTDRLVVILANTSTVHRYNLATFEREKSLGLPSRAKVDSIHLGYASKGPMLVSGKDAAGKDASFFVNIYTMGMVLYKMADPKQRSFQFGGAFARAGADNKVICRWSPNISPQNQESIILGATTLRINGSGGSYGHAVPSFDGRYIYTAQGVFSPEWKPLSKETRNNAPWTTAAIGSGDYYVSADLGRFRTEKPKGLNIHLAGDERAIVKLTNVDMPKDLNPWGREAFGADKRILFIPDADVLITVPDAADRLVMQRFKLEEELKKTDVDYLVVTSRPPTSVRRDAVFTYKLKVVSKKGGLKYRVDSGPKGMSVSEDGQVRWLVPLTAPYSQNVVIAIRDAGGQEKFHTFTITILERLPG